jgi:RimJ/RimL family protein N-acetyltransferase
VSVLEPTTIQLRSGQACLLRSAEAKDAGALIDNMHRILREPHAVSAPDEVVITEEVELVWIEQHRAKPGWIVIVAEVDGELIGHVDFQTRPRRRIAHVGSVGLSVQKPWRRRGVAEALMRELLSWAAREPGIDKVSLAVFADNQPAIALYKKLGFAWEGRRCAEIRLDDGTYVDDILMAKRV